jgi:hypothetical protein
MIYLKKIHRLNRIVLLIISIIDVNTTVLKKIISVIHSSSVTKLSVLAIIAIPTITAIIIRSRIDSLPKISSKVVNTEKTVASC